MAVAVTVVVGSSSIATHLFVAASLSTTAHAAFLFLSPFKFPCPFPPRNNRTLGAAAVVMCNLVANDTGRDQWSAEDRTRDRARSAYELFRCFRSKRGMGKERQRKEASGGVELDSTVTASDSFGGKTLASRSSSGG